VASIRASWDANRERRRTQWRVQQEEDLAVAEVNRIVAEEAERQRRRLEAEARAQLSQDHHRRGTDDDRKNQR
jgi:hypothetical protein